MTVKTNSHQWHIRTRDRRESRTAFDVGTDAAYICTVHGLTPTDAYENACLVAAAPELYRELATLVSLCEVWITRDVLNRSTEVLDLARAALSKARP